MKFRILSAGIFAKHASARLSSGKGVGKGGGSGWAGLMKRPNTGCRANYLWLSMKKRSKLSSTPVASQGSKKEQSEETTNPIKGGPIPDEVRASLPKEDQIAARAHQIWVDQGRPEGRDEEHWFQALCELTSDPPIK